jgi:transcriptional regulator with XRE-family HTH domain
LSPVQKDKTRSYIKIDVELSMDFTVEFYETESGACPVREFLDEKSGKMKKTNFDRYLEDQLKDPAFAARFERAGEAWDVALQIAALRQQAGLSQKDLAKLLKTSQQQISRLESPGYEGHSLSTLRRVAEVLHARVRVVFEPLEKETGMHAAEARASYHTKRLQKKDMARRRRRGRSVQKDNGQV